MKKIIAIIILIQVILVNIFTFFVIPLVYNQFKGHVSYDYFAKSRIKYLVKTEGFTFAYVKKGEEKILKISDTTGNNLSINISSVDESTIKNALFYDWSLVDNVNGEDIYIPSINYCNYMELNLNVIPGIKSINDNVKKGEEVQFALEPIKCLAVLPADNLETINEHFE